MTDRLKRTLRYCVVLFVFTAPLYYVVSGFLWEEVTPRDRLITALLYGGINVLFFGSIHYFFRRGGGRSDGRTGTEPKS